MSTIGIKPADILIPRNIDMEKWSVIACDQYTGEPEYWAQLDRLVGDEPSTLRLIFPEVYLEDGSADQRIRDINRSMSDYLQKGIFAECAAGYIYTRRTLRSGQVRRGLMAMMDLEAYDYNKGSGSLIRATEGTVLSRIPPRVRVRENAPLETPHIMILIDDRTGSVIEPLDNQKDRFEKLYDFELNMGGGSIQGYLVDKAAAQQLERAVAQLADAAAFRDKYGVDDKPVLLFAVGDGNHSLATAKACYEAIKQRDGAEAALASPARWALAEIVNVHEATLEFEPIHRVLFGVDSGHLLAEMGQTYDLAETPCEGQKLIAVTPEKEKAIWIKNPPSNLAVGSLQQFLDAYLQRFGGDVDYIHGDDVTRRLGSQPGNMGFLLPHMDKNDLFKTVILDGALPRKTFSMGHAWDKRYYLECRKIR